MRVFAIPAAALATLTLSACGGSDVQEPVEQIVVAEPGEAASYPGADEPAQTASDPEQASE